MLNRPLSFAVVAVAAVGVAGGAYFAARQSAPEPIPIETPAVATDASTVESSPVVTGTEAIIALEPASPGRPGEACRYARAVGGCTGGLRSTRTGRTPGSNNSTDRTAGTRSHT